MKIKLSKSQWEMIGNKTGWKTAQSKTYYLKTYINDVDDGRILYLDASVVLHSLNYLDSRIKELIFFLQNLPKNAHPNIKKAKSIVLELTNLSGKVLKTFDITKDVLKTVESKTQEKTIEKTASLPNPYKVGDKVTLKEDVLQSHSRSVSPQSGYTKEQFEWREILKNLIGKIGTVSRVFPNSTNINVDFDTNTIGISSTEVNPVSSVPKTYKEIYKDKIFEASICGTKAFNEGKKRIPALDKNLMSLIDSLNNQEVGSSKPLLNAWLESWDAANLSKE